jgi:1-acyl-sn-glycerol-3-phosphate acyltransferase
VLRAWFDLHQHGTHNVPSTGPVILAPNHIGLVDGPLLAIVGPRPVHALTKREMFAGGGGLFLRATGQIPLDRFHPDPRAIKLCLRVLRDGHAVGVFPEGTRGAGDLERFRRGAAYLALVSGAPVVPVVMLGTRLPGEGSHAIPARGARIDIVYGEAWRVRAQPWPRRTVDVASANAALRTHMLHVLHEALVSTGRSLPGPLPSGDREVVEAIAEESHD